MRPRVRDVRRMRCAQIAVKKQKFRSVMRSKLASITRELAELEEALN